MKKDVDGLFISNFAGSDAFAGMNLIWPAIAVVSAVAAFVRTLVFELAAVFALPAIIGIEGIWMSVNVAEILALVLSMSLIFGFRKRYGY